MVSLKQEPMATGPAVCLRCRHRWEVTAPVGVTQFDCPECSLQKGVRAGLCEKREPHWTCLCGSQYFHITADGAYCPACGLDQAWGPGD